MAGSDNDFHMGHRERLRQKFLDGKLADYELLEMLLGYAIPRRDDGAFWWYSSNLGCAVGQIG